MRFSTGVPLLLLSLAPWATARAQSVLPIVDKCEVPQLRQNCTRLIEALEGLKIPLPEETIKDLRAALKSSGPDEATLEQIQKALDRHCLVGVHINPESRVKAARGPCKAVFSQGATGFFLVKVHNEAGVTQALTLTSPHFVERGMNRTAEQWLSGSIHSRPPMPARLTGHEVEYVIMALGTTETGKREAKLVFDVGQGTQDLGFRAEVPILFEIRQSAVTPPLQQP